MHLPMTFGMRNSQPSFRQHPSRYSPARQQSTTTKLSSRSVVALPAAAFVAMDELLKPLYMATSKPARQTYLNTALLLFTSTILLVVAAFAYVLFFMNFIPQIGIERVIHLQFLPSSFVQKPYAFVSLQSSVIVQQTYDVKVELDLPRSPLNLEAGNFMIDMRMLSSSFNPKKSALGSDITSVSRIIDSIPHETILFASSRPAILTYQSPLVALSKQVAGLPWYLLNWRREAEKLEIVMAEGVTFPRGSRNVPETVYLELHTHGSDIEVYAAKLKLRARFSGLRWLMYNHRLVSFILFTSAFWTAELLFAILTWLMWNSLSTPGEVAVKGETKGEESDASTAIKAEVEEDGPDTDDADLSDTPRNFPTYGRQPPLYYAPKVKSELDSEEQTLDHATIQPLAAEADDESEEPIDIRGYVGRSDSGIGTSFSEGPRSSGTQRRRSRGGG